MDLLKPLIALLAIVNPIGVVPFFISFTQGFSREQRRRTIRVSAFTAFLVVALSALAGIKIIEFFGISIASFQVGGGTLLLISALQMLSAVYEGALVDFDTALRIESRYLAKLIVSPVAKNMINTFFFNMNAIKSGQSRPGASTSPGHAGK